MGLEFIKRVQRATLVVGVLAFAFVALYYSPNFGLGMLVGCLWGVANFWALEHVLTAVLRPDAVDRRRAFIFAGIKFPVLYAAGIIVLWKGWFEPVSLVAGFSLLFLVVLLKALGRTVLKMDQPAPSKEAHHRL
ncbi:MAG: hypothetical protein GF341_12585 [candidate division Zixibacteria bacterium]|nr:hypothetical protein [candidate division Zixibacteria bacterium]